MRSGHSERFDFFLSRRGSVAAIAREVADVLTEKGYKVLVQDYDIPLGASFVEAMHEAIKNSRNLVILFTHDYEESPYTRKEFTSFEAERAQSVEERHIIVLRCEDVPLRGLLADNVYQDLVGIDDPEERKRRIVAAVGRQSQALAPVARPFVGVPPRIAGFTGRADALDRLDAILMRDTPAALTQAVGRAAVQGMGGVGKTSLAVEYAHGYRKLYAGVWWCPAETRAGLLNSLAALAVTLGVAAPQETNVEETAKAALRRLGEQGATWLLIYDNVPRPEEIADLMPAAGVRLLITSRFFDWGGWADEVPLDVLPWEEAVSFLQSRAGRNDETGAKRLAETLGRLPLALDHAAAYCKRSQMRFAEYAQKVEKLIASAPRGAGYPRSVAGTFDLAIADAITECPSAEALMAYCAQCAPERIPMTLIDGAIEDDVERMEALVALAEVSLVKHDPFEDGAPAVILHRLVQKVARARSEADGAAPQIIDRLITRLSAIFPHDEDANDENAAGNPKSWPLCAQLTPHVMVQWDAGVAQTLKLPEWAELLHRTGSYFFARASYSEAGQLFRNVVEIREKVLGAEHLDTANTLNNLAGLLRAQGDLAGARELYKRVLAIREKALGPEHIYTATSLNNLALVMSDQGDLATARPLYERAGAIFEKALGPEHPWTAGSLLNLARLLWGQRDMAGARTLFDRVLAIDEKTLGPDHPGTAATLLNFARLLRDQGDVAGARAAFERALTIFESVLGPEHPDTATSLSGLADFLRIQGDLVAARPLYERVLAIRERALGPNHPTTGSSLNNVAVVLHAQGDFAGARPLYERALAVCEKALDPEDRATNRVRHHLARLLVAMGQPTEALELAETALASHDKVLGRDHSWTADSARVTADALDALGRADEAAALRRRYEVTSAEEAKQQ